MDGVTSLSPCGHYGRVGGTVPDEGDHAVEAIVGVLFKGGEVSCSVCLGAVYVVVG